MVMMMMVVMVMMVVVVVVMEGVIGLRTEDVCSELLLRTCLHETVPR
jgi:hypothetical protein